MRLTPRANEVKAVAAVLEDASHESAEALAKAVIKTVADLLEEREFYALAWRDKAGPDALSLAWGIFPSENEAAKFLGKLDIGGMGRPIKLYSAAEMTARIDAPDDPAGRRLCSTCEHPHGTHMHEKRLGKCQVSGCGCTTDTK